MLFDYATFRRARCPKAQRAALEPLVARLFDMAEKARQQGILALEDEALREEHPLLKAGLKAVVDGVDDSLVEELMRTMINVGGARGKALLEQLMIATGVEIIQDGWNPDLVRTFLDAYIDGDRPKSAGGTPGVAAEGE